MDETRVDDGARRRELAAFLRHCRERLQPDHVGLASSPRRRTPGLRREEVAYLANVSISWYASLEQARDIAVSDSVLQSLARTLRLNATERRHLLALAGRNPRSAPPADVSAAMAGLVDELDRTPACVVDRNWDIGCSNRGFWALIGNPSSLAPQQRNLLWLLFTDARSSRLIPDWEEEAERLVGQLRVAQVQEHRPQQRSRELVEHLGAASPRFQQLWQSNVVHGSAPRFREFSHERAGGLSMNHLELSGVDAPDQRIVTLLPADASARDRIGALVSAGYQRELRPLPVPV